MAYFLQVKDKNGNFRTVNIKKSEIFQQKNITKAYKRSGGYSIRELDHFTTLFEDENSLKNHLLVSGLLAHDLLECPIMIRFINKNGASIKYNLLYQEDLAYFYAPNILINLVVEKFEMGDFKFLNDLARRFYHFRECSATAAELLNLTNLAINNGYVDKEGFSELDANGDNIVKRLVKLLIYKGNEYNWRTFHTLIDFINSYEVRKEAKKEAPAVKVDSQLNPKKKEKVKKPEILPKKDENEFEQLSFSDLSDN